MPLCYLPPGRGGIPTFTPANIVLDLVTPSWRGVAVIVGCDRVPGVTFPPLPPADTGNRFSDLGWMQR